MYRVLPELLAISRRVWIDYDEEADIGVKAAFGSAQAEAFAGLGKE